MLILFSPEEVKGRNFSEADNFRWAKIMIIPIIRLFNKDNSLITSVLIGIIGNPIDCDPL